MHVCLLLLSSYISFCHGLPESDRSSHKVKPFCCLLKKNLMLLHYLLHIPSPLTVAEVLMSGRNCTETSKVKKADVHWCFVFLQVFCFLSATLNAQLLIKYCKLQTIQHHHSERTEFSEIALKPLRWDFVVNKDLLSVYFFVLELLKKEKQMCLSQIFLVLNIYLQCPKEKVSIPNVFRALFFFSCSFFFKLYFSFWKQCWH